MGSQGYRYNTSSGFPSFGCEGKSERRSILCILPCTVSQLLSANENNDSFFIRGVVINQVSVVGLNRRSMRTGTNVVYSVDDMTGRPLDVKLWLNTENDELDYHTIPSGSYVKVVGSLRSFQHYRFLIAFSIRLVEDPNEITSHMLEVIQAHLLSDADSYSRMKNRSKTPAVIPTSYANDPATTGFTANQRKGCSKTGSLQSLGTTQSCTSSKSPSDLLIPKHFPPLICINDYALGPVFYLIKNCHLAEGITRQRLETVLEYLSPYDIRNCLQFLINEGHIFSTVDENHFKSTYG